MKRTIFSGESVCLRNIREGPNRLYPPSHQSKIAL
jgi:hypothetical protein